MNKLLSIFALLIFPVILLSVQSFYRVDETEQVIITENLWVRSFRIQG